MLNVKNFVKMLKYQSIGYFRRYFCLADTSKCLLTEYLDNQGGLLTTDKNIYTAIASAQSVKSKQVQRHLKFSWL